MRSVIVCMTVCSVLFCLEAAESFSAETRGSVYNAADFGAVGDGSQDDSGAIQAAIDSAFKAGGGSVVLPPPKIAYRVSKNISVKSHVILSGAAGKTPVILDNAYFTTEGHRAIIIENLKFSGKERKSPCVRTYSSRNPTDADLVIRNNHFEGCSFGIYSAHWIRNVVVEDNFFTDCGYGLYLHTVDNWKIINNRFQKPIVRPMEIHNGHHNLVSGNYIEGDKAGTIIGILFMTNASLPTDGPSNNIVTNNTVMHIAEEGIMMEETVANAFKAGGTVSRAVAGTITQDGAAWKQDAFAGREVMVVDGTGAGQWRKVVSNSEDTLTVEKDWTVVPDRTTKFTVVKAIRGNIISGNIVEDAGTW